MLLILNGAISGLVAVTAGPDMQNPLMAVIIGSCGSHVSDFCLPCSREIEN